MNMNEIIIRAREYQEALCATAIPLAPCPWCTGAPTITIAYRDRLEYLAVCRACGASGPRAASSDAAARRWNSRERFKQ